MQILRKRKVKQTQKKGKHPDRVQNVHEMKKTHLRDIPEI